MRRRQHHGRDRTGRAPQFDLFAPLPAADHPETTVWRALPEETQRSLTGLLARLLQHGVVVSLRVVQVVDDKNRRFAVFLEVSPYDLGTHFHAILRMEGNKGRIGYPERAAGHPVRATRRPAVSARRRAPGQGRAGRSRPSPRRAARRCRRKGAGSHRFRAAARLAARRRCRACTGRQRAR